MKVLSRTFILLSNFFLFFKTDVVSEEIFVFSIQLCNSIRILNFVISNFQKIMFFLLELRDGEFSKNHKFTIHRAFFERFFFQSCRKRRHRSWNFQPLTQLHIKILAAKEELFTSTQTSDHQIFDIRLTDMGKVLRLVIYFHYETFIVNQGY